jgi:hypothetical protein
MDFGVPHSSLWTFGMNEDRRSNVILLDLLPGEDLSLGLPRVARGLNSV